MTTPEITPLGRTPPETPLPEALPPEDARIARISDVMGRLRVLIGRRVISRIAIERVAPGTELSFVDVLSHVPERVGAADDPGQGVSIGAVAQALRIDPSRASRLVGRMVTQGLLTRVAAPGDARSSLVLRTARGQRLHEEMRAVKRGLIGGAVAGWPPAEVEAFAARFDRFISEWERLIAAEGRRPVPEPELPREDG